MATALGYIFVLPENRKSNFTDNLEAWGDFAEPVADFSHSRNVPLICFISSEDGMITHISKGKRGLRAGTDLRRLNFNSIRKLSKPISLAAISEKIAPRFKKSVQQRIESGGLLTLKGFEAVVDAIRKIDPDTKEILNQFSPERARKIAAMSQSVKNAMAYQKEAVITALAFAGIDRDVLHEWSPPASTESKSPATSFLDGISSTRLREDPMVINDLNKFPGFSLVKSLPYNAAVFENDDSDVRLTIVLANRQPLEQQLGTDLIYYNETFKSFVFVQYKAMEMSNREAFFALPSEQLNEEIARMDKTSEILKKSTPNKECEGYRLNENPFFLKLCPRLVFNPDNVGLIPGMYIPLDYWKILETSSKIVGIKGGKRVTYKNAGRYIDNNLFSLLVTKSWVGTSISQSGVLEKIIKDTLDGKKAIAIGIKQDLSRPR